MTKSVELLAGYWTIAGNIPSFMGDDSSPFDFRDRVVAAARAGYRGIGIKHADLMKVKARYGFAEMKAILAANGIKHLELEALFDWFTAGERRRASDIVRHDLLVAAEALGARHIKIAGDFGAADWPVEVMTEAFETLCAEAANAGTRVGVEIIPFSNIKDIATALAIVGDTKNRNGGMLLDIWHITRGGISYDDMARIPANCITSVELNDASAVQVGSMLEDTLDRRKFCGEGDFDVPAFIRAVVRTGYVGPFGVEIISAELRKLPLEEAANRSFATTYKQFEGITL